MADLILSPHIADPDDFYAALLAVHEGRDPAAVHALNARLVLILANQIGDKDVLQQVLMPRLRHQHLRQHQVATDG